MEHFREADINLYLIFPMRRYRSLRRKFLHQWKSEMCLWIVLSSLIFVTCINNARGQEVSSCCSKAMGSCKSVCEKMSLMEIAADTAVRDERLMNIYKFCSPELTEFWVCLNETLREVLVGSEWWGRTCCGLARARNCGRACATSSNTGALQPSCRRSDEQPFFECLDRQSHGQECCSNTRSLSCHEACEDIFKSQLTPTKEQRGKVVDLCEENSPKVMQCIKNYTKVTPASDTLKYLPCCEEAPEIECRSTCQTVLLGGGSIQEILDALQRGGCGTPLPHLPLWQCFLRADSQTGPDNHISNSDRLGMDSAKLHCCHKANSTLCRRLCLNTFTNDWAGRWERFDSECLKQPQQSDLVACIDEAEEPCELGCEGLSYCTNFNNRPTELFRACNAHADTAAKYDAALWQSQGYLELPGLHLPVRNTSRCSPQVWRAVACMLQVKPCSRQEHATRVCREDCFKVLSHCVDWPRLPGDHNAATLCSKLSPDESDAPCVSLQNFMEPSDNPYMEPSEQVTSPCKGETCNSSKICIINRNCLHGWSCKPFTCNSGCALGEASQFLVPEGTYVRIPISNSQKGCLKICQCSAKGVIDKCQPLPCFTYDSCILANKHIQHGSIFYMECNICSCFAGEIVCSKKQCGPQPADTELALAPYPLPCGCPNHHVPVCGANGNTYPNSCLAKCAGGFADSEIEFGPCVSKGVCQESDCPKGFSCLPRPTVCLSILHRPCLQYICANISGCSTQPEEPVCDTEGRSHPSPCQLLATGKQLAYMGRCLTKCSQVGTVCGVNGNTYDSECAAWADCVGIDYLGPCIAVGAITDTMANKCPLEGVVCLSLARPDCLGYTPPGACCPVCGGALKLLYSRKQIDRALYALRGEASAALTLKSLLTALQRHIQVAECVLRGYLTVESDIFVMVQSTEAKASDLQLEACVREAEKLANLVRRHSARIASELSLSSLTVATEVHTSPSAGFCINSLPILFNITSLLLCTLVAIFAIRFS